MVMKENMSLLSQAGPKARGTPCMALRNSVCDCCADCTLNLIWRLCRSANRGAPKAMKGNKGLLSQAVTKALEPSFFFAMFEQDVDDFITGKTPNGAASTTSGRCVLALSQVLISACNRRVTR